MRGFDSRLKLRHLTIIAAVAEHGSLVRASEALFISQPVATRAIQELEEILGVDLFERHVKGMSPTPYGEAYIRHAQSVLAELRNAQAHLEQIGRADVGTVTIGTYLAASHLLLPQAIERAKLAHPGLRVVVREDTIGRLRNDLASGELDVITGRATPNPDDDHRFEFTTLYREPMDVVTGVDHPAQGEPISSVDQLLEHPWILPAAETDLRQEVDLYFARHSARFPTDVVECNSFLTVRHLLATGRYLAVLPHLIVRDDPALTPLQLRLETVGRAIGITVLRSANPTPAGHAMLRTLRQVGAELHEELTTQS